MLNRKYFILFLLIFLSINNTYSKNSNINNDDILKITSDKTEIFKNENKIIFSKNVISKYKTSTLKCDKMIVYYIQNRENKNNNNINKNIEIDRIEFFNNIDLKNENLKAKSKNGIYDYKKNLIILKNNIKAIQNNTTLYADELIYDIDTGKTNIKNKNKKVKVVLE